jgi:hypothetical protein
MELKEITFKEKKSFAIEMCNKQMSNYTEEKTNEGLMIERKLNGKSWTNKEYLDAIVNETEDGIKFIDTLWNFKLYLDELGKKY